MDRRFALVAVWAVFAAASVGVGFGAAGLVGTPFIDAASTVGGGPSAPGGLTTVPSTTSSAPARTPEGERSGSAETESEKSAGSSSGSAPDVSAQGSRSGPGTSRPGTGRGGTGSSRPRGSATSSPDSSGESHEGDRSGTTVTRASVSTRGGYVSGGCRSGLIALSASPAVGWELGGVTSGRSSAGEVEFEQLGDSDGKVTVRAWCAAGRPQFGVENDDSSGGGEGGGSDGSEDDN